MARQEVEDILKEKAWMTVRDVFNKMPFPIGLGTLSSCMRSMVKAREIIVRSATVKTADKNGKVMIRKINEFKLEQIDLNI